MTDPIKFFKQGIALVDRHEGLEEAYQKWTDVVLEEADKLLKLGHEMGSRRFAEDIVCGGFMGAFVLYAVQNNIPKQHILDIVGAAYDGAKFEVTRAQVLGEEKPS